MLLKQKEFCRAMGITVNSSPTVPTREQLNLARKLIEEEFRELIDEMDQVALVVSDGTISDGPKEALSHSYLQDATAEAADLIYVVCQFCNMFGLPLTEMYDAIHAANMRKVNPNTGKVERREDGKVLKPEGWKPAELTRIYLNARTGTPVV
jgi:predicted HAD superfamily Cof-like phosphohydrolase